MRTRKLMLLPILLAALTSVATGRIDYEDVTPTVSPHEDTRDTRLTTLLTRPYLSKGLSPVKITLKKGVAPLLLCVALQAATQR